MDHRFYSASAIFPLIHVDGNMATIRYQSIMLLAICLLLIGNDGAATQGDRRTIAIRCHCIARGMDVHFTIDRDLCGSATINCCICRIQAIHGTKRLSGRCTEIPLHMDLTLAICLHDIRLVINSCIRSIDYHIPIHIELGTIGCHHTISIISPIGISRTIHFHRSCRDGRRTGSRHLQHRGRL